MSLQIGQRVGSYEITSLLGKGGMGEVYLARDARLDRSVAIKTLPEQFESDAERLARFEREAKILASLNHPNIGAIYGLEKHDGRHILVLELVEGQTLADLVARGPMPMNAETGGPDCRSAAGGARKRRHPSRFEAGQHQNHTRRHGEGSRF